MRTITSTAVLLAGAAALFTGCGGQAASPATTAAAVSPGATVTSPTVTSPADAAPSPSAAATPASSGKPPGPAAADGVQVVAKPDNIAVLVNKTYMLPADYKPNDLVEPNVPFIFKEKSEKRLMRKEAAQALEKLFAAAAKDGIRLGGVSAYRSYATQKGLFNTYAKSHGEQEARKFSALPGHSEHETGLAIDLSDSSGKCAAEDCFGGTAEAKWLASHAPEYGFIIRYPKGKESITGYQYEPWHIRYVGTQIAKEISSKGLTLEEYLRNAVPAVK